MDSINAYPKHTPTMNPANPVDTGFNIAVRSICNRCLPQGFDTVKDFDDAPTSLEAMTAHVKQTGRFLVAEADSDGTIFDCADTNYHLRAWHDSVHFRHQLAFNVAGEAAAVYVQVAQLYRVFGVRPETVKWGSYLLADILGLVLHVKQTGKYPKNKRAGTVNAAPKWRRIAQMIADGCGDLEHEQAALFLAASEWGSPR